MARRPAGPRRKPLTAKTKSGYLRVARTFFRDCQEWEWIPRRFDPSHALGTPRSVKALLGPDPRVIADDVWAKLLWAGLNLSPGDAPKADGRSYPAELIRALTLTWLFSGQRSDEIARLRVGCIRWQHDMLVPGGGARAPLSPETAMRRLEEVGEATRASLGQARRAIRALRPEALEHGSLSRALGELAAEFGAQTGIEAHSAVTGQEGELDPDAQEALLRVAQEALANVRKHARARRVQLTLSYLDDATLLDVRHDGTGFDPAAPAGNGSGGGFGLAGMRERLAVQGGTLTVETAPGQGTTVVAALPRGPADAGHDRR